MNCEVYYINKTQNFWKKIKLTLDFFKELNWIKNKIILNLKLAWTK